MAREREFRIGGEYAQAAERLHRGRRQYERGLREVHFGGDPLHLLARQPFGGGDDGQRIPGERAVGENVRLKEPVFAHERPESIR